MFNKVFECINNLGKFSGKNNFGIEEEMQILNYVLIKAKPKNMYTNLEFLELFIGNKKDDIEGHNLATLIF